jgi:hypothetical protein
MNMIKKKTWWKDTAALIQDAIMDGLHCDSSPIDSHYTRGMKRRIWYTIRELDLQNSFEYGIPTLLHTIESNVVAPLNINDEEFHETSKELCISKSPNQFTSTSYQSQSSRSWELRLDISRRLYSTGTSNSLNYEDVLRYSHEINQMLDLLPSWEKEKIDGEDNLSLLAYAYLSFQLKECILSIHRPYLQQLNGKFWLSENITYQISREILLLNSRLGRVGIQNLTLLREDLLLASLSITRITLLQPKCKLRSLPGDLLKHHAHSANTKPRQAPAVSSWQAPRRRSISWNNVFHSRSKDTLVVSMVSLGASSLCMQQSCSSNYT